MGILTRIFEARSQYSTLASPEPWLIEALGGRPTATGIQVSPTGSLAVSAVYACVRVLSEDLAKLPLHLYRRLPGGGREKATEHKLYDILHRQPNPVTTSFSFREAAQASVLLYGNAYAYIDWGPDGYVRGLWLLDPNRVVVYGSRDNLGRVQVSYGYMPETGGMVHIDARDMLHIPGMSFDGICGVSVIRYARENIGLAMATREFGGRYFANDAMPGVIVFSPRRLTEEEKAAVREEFRKKYRGLERKFELAILETGWDFKTIPMPLEDAQFVESRKFEVEEIARMFRVPLHKIGHLEHATYSNIEQQSIEYVTDALESWCVRWEQAMWAKLLTEEDKRQYYPQFNLDALIRGDTESRYGAYARAILSGFLTPNEVRELENRNPLPGGDTVWMPVNMTPAGQAAGLEQPPARASRVLESRSRQAAYRQRLMRAYRPVLQDALARIARREVNDIRRAMKKHLGRRSQETFNSWLEAYFREEVPEVWALNMAPALRGYFEAVVPAVQEEVGSEQDILPQLEPQLADYIDSHARRHAALTRMAVQAVVTEAAASGGDVSEAVEAHLREYEETYPGDEAMEQSHRFGNYIARLAFLALGITVLRWVAAGHDPCPLCKEMNGKTVGRDTTFLNAGSKLEAGGVSHEVDTHVFHPPLHKGCECIISRG